MKIAVKTVSEIIGNSYKANSLSLEILQLNKFKIAVHCGNPTQDRSRKSPVKYNRNSPTQDRSLESYSEYSLKPRNNFNK